MSRVIIQDSKCPEKPVSVTFQERLLVKTHDALQHVKFHVIVILLI